MQVLIDLTDLQSAPENVRKWLVEKMTGHSSPEPETPETPETPEPSKAKSSKAKSSKAKRPTKKEVLAKAKELIDLAGEEALVEALAKLEISRVSECPDDKLADLLAEIAVHL